MLRLRIVAEELNNLDSGRRLRIFPVVLPPLDGMPENAEHLSGFLKRDTAINPRLPKMLADG